MCPKLKVLWLFDHNIPEPHEAKRRLQQALGPGVHIFGLDEEEAKAPKWSMKSAQKLSPFKLPSKTSVPVMVSEFGKVD